MKTEPIKKKHRACDCGDEHWFKDCLYLGVAKRSTNWTLVKGVEKLMEEKIRASPKRQAIIGIIRG